MFCESEYLRYFILGQLISKPGYGRMLQNFYVDNWRAYASESTFQVLNSRVGSENYQQTLVKVRNASQGQTP